MIVLDTNVIIRYVQGDERVVSWLDGLLMEGERLAISSLTIVELLSFERLTEREEFLIEQWLKKVLVIDVDAALARLASKLRKQHQLTAIDSIVAATAAALHVPLATQDRAFKKLKQIQIMEI